MAQDTCSDARTISSNEVGAHIAEECCINMLPEKSEAVGGSVTVAPLTILTTAEGDGGSAVGGIWNYNIDPENLITLCASGLTQNVAGLVLGTGTHNLKVDTNSAVAMTLTVNGPIATTWDGTALTGADQDIVLPIADSQSIEIIGNVTIKSVTFDKTTTVVAQNASDGPDWYPREPNDYGSVGGELNTQARRPLSPSRQLQRGDVVGFDAEADFTEDLTQTNLQRIAQGFFFADSYDKPRTDPFNTPTMTVGAVDGTAKTVIVNSLSGDGLEITAGYIVKLSGMGDPANDIVSHVSALDGTATPQTLTLDEDLVDEATPPDVAAVRAVGYQFALGDASFLSTESLARMVVVGVDLTTLNLQVGEWVYIGGDTPETTFDQDQGFARIATIASGEITFDYIDWTPSTVLDSAAAKTVQIFFGRVIKNEKELSKIKRRTYTMERTLGSDDDGPQAQYVGGLVANEMTLSLPSEDFVGLEMRFVGLDEYFRNGKDGLYPGTRHSLPSESAFNTSNSLLFFDLYKHDAMVTATALFGYAEEAELTITNNAEIKKALGTLGGIDITVGNFEVTGSIDAYLSTVEALQAVRANVKSGMTLALGKENSGMVLDMPLVTLGREDLETEQDEAVMVPLTVSGAENDNGYTALFTFFPHLPDAAMSQN